MTDDKTTNFTVYDAHGQAMHFTDAEVVLDNSGTLRITRGGNQIAFFPDGGWTGLVEDGAAVSHPIP